MKRKRSDSGAKSTSKKVSSKKNQPAALFNAVDSTERTSSAPLKQQKSITQESYPPDLLYDIVEKQEALRTSVLGPLYTHIEQEDIAYDQLEEGLGMKLEKKVYEPFVIQDYRLLLPLDALDPFILNEILSIHTWKNVLSEYEREYLKQFLPILPNAPTLTPTATTTTTTTNSTSTSSNIAKISESNISNTDISKSAIAESRTANYIVARLLNGENFHFGNDKQKLIDRMLAGYYHPLVTRERNKLNFLEKKNYDINFCLYSKMIEDKIEKEKMEQLGELDEDSASIPVSRMEYNEEVELEEEDVFEDENLIVDE